MASSSHVSDDVAPAPNSISSQSSFLNDDSPVTESWCHTGSKVVKFKFNWTIHDFSLRREKHGEMLESSDFSVGPNEELKWTLRTWPKGREKTDDYLALFLNLVSAKYECTEFPAKFRLSILQDWKEGVKKTIMRRSSEHIFDLESRPDWGFNKFIKLDSLLETDNKFLPNNNLTIVCDGTVSVDKVNVVKLTSEYETKIPKRSLSKNLFSLFEDGEFSDVTLSVDGKDIPAHKIILSARSPVFAAMFKSELEESKQNRVVITDMKFEVLQEMLSYIYSGKSPNVETMADDSLVAANKYDLSGLQEMCVTVLCSRVTVENAADLLVLADVHCAKRLKARVISFITMRAKEVMLTPSWKKLSSNHPHVAIEALQAVVSHSFP